MRGRIRIVERLQDEVDRQLAFVPNQGHASSVHSAVAVTREGSRLGTGFIHALVRQGQVHAANLMVGFRETAHSQAPRLARNIDYRLAAGYAIGAVFDRLTLMKRRFVGRPKSNAVLQRLTEPQVTRPPGRPLAGGYEILIDLGSYRARDSQSSQRKGKANRPARKKTVGFRRTNFRDSPIRTLQLSLDHEPKCPSHAQTQVLAVGTACDRSISIDMQFLYV